MRPSLRDAENSNGTIKNPRKLVDLLAEFDVPIRFGAAVERIDTHAGKARGVHLESGEYLLADIVISNADPTVAYSRMLDPRALRRHTPARSLRKRQSMSLFVGYFGTSRQYPDTKHHTIILGPRYVLCSAKVLERVVPKPNRPVVPVLRVARDAASLFPRTT